MSRNSKGPGTAKALFPLEQLVTMSGALEAMCDAGGSTVALALLRRHVTGDWSEMDEHDRDENRLSVAAGLRVFSAYTLETDVKVWIITEADRSATTFLLPDEY